MFPPVQPTRRRRKKTLRKPQLSIEILLSWADDHRERTGAWPTVRCGRVLANLNETWFNVDQCLRKGFRGLPGKQSLPKLLERERGARNLTYPPQLTEEMIVRWALAHRLKKGDWPTQDSGTVEGQPGESWRNIDGSLLAGRRGLPGGDSLARLFSRRFGVRNPAESPPLAEEAIAAWADEHRRRTGNCPAIKSGPVGLSPDDTWAAVDDALRRGNRGLPGGSSLAKLLAERRGRRNGQDLPKLTEETVLSWADDHHARTGRWPTPNSGGVLASPGETWCGVNNALKHGGRGMQGGDSLSLLLARHDRKPRAARPNGSRRRQYRNSCLLA
jgi:hypothetical protein